MNQMIQFEEVDQSPAQNAAALLFDAPRMHALMTFAEMMAKSAVTVPEHLRGKPSDCMAIAMQAIRWGMDPFVVAQKTHIVSGKLGYEAQLVNAVVQSSNAISGSFHYEFQGSGNDLQCRVGAVLRNESEITWGEWLRNGDVKTRNSPLWNVNPKQQLAYLQVKNWARLYCPGAILGIYTPEEIDGPKNMGEVEEVDRPRGPQRKSATAAPATAVVNNVIDTGASASTDATPKKAEEAAPATIATPPASGAGPLIGTGQLAYLRNKLKSQSIEESTICARFEIGSLDGLTVEQFDEVKAELLAMS